MKYVMMIVVSLVVMGCGVAPGATAAGSTTAGAYCNPGYCYSYLLNYCCASSAPYACGESCYTYSGGGGCSSYKTQCY